MSNPFTLSFGKKPAQFISRITQTNEIVEKFKAEVPSIQIYMITGVRGSGKTVMMTTVSNIIQEDNDWIAIELNPVRDLLQSLAAKLYGTPELHALFLKAKFDFSAFGLGVSVENAAPVTDIETAIGLMLGELKKAGKRLLITIDEATNSENIRVFASSFQIFLRQDYPLFLLMTGLYDNLYDLQNDKSITFLYRAPKIVLDPLNYTAVKKHYMDIFQLDVQNAEHMAMLTKGYPFAFQVLGYLYWENRDHMTIDDILPEYDQYLEEYVYSKIWSEMSELDKKIVYEMSVSGETRIKNIRERLGMKSELFSVYRDRLKRKGVVSTEQYAHLTLALPRFDEFVKSRLIYKEHLISAVFSLLILWRSNLWIACGLHGIWNFLLYGVFGMTLSGSDAETAGIFLIKINAQNIVTGGEYGLEAGIACTVVLAAAVAILMLLTRKHASCSNALDKNLITDYIS